MESTCTAHDAMVLDAWCVSGVCVSGWDGMSGGGRGGIVRRETMLMILVDIVHNSQSDLVFKPASYPGSSHVSFAC